MEAMPSARTRGRRPRRRQSRAAPARRWRSCSRSCWAVPVGASTRRSSARRSPASSATSSGTNELYTWVVTIYLLTSHDHRRRSTASCPTSTAASPMLLIGITIFLIGSVLSGLAMEHGEPHPVPGHPGRRRRCHLPDLARGHRRPVHAAPSAASTRACSAPCSASRDPVGPLLGGWLTENLSWHWIFYVNLPIGVVAPRSSSSGFLPTVHGERRDPQPRLPRRRACSRSRSRSC